MKRWLVVLLVVLAVLLLVSPGIIGRIAERNLEQNVDWARSENNGVEIRTESFVRGWFTSEGRHRVTLSTIVFADAAAEYQLSTGNKELPSLIIDTRLDHGLVPVGDAGSLAPGLANMLSTFQFDPGDGELVDLPGSLRSKIGLTGTTDSRFLLETGEFENEAGRIEWTGADLNLQTDWSDGTVAIVGTVQPITIAADGETLRIGAINIDANQVRSGYGFNDGAISFSLESIDVDSPTNPATIDALLFSANADVDDDRLSFGSKISLDRLLVPAVGEASFTLDFTMDDLDAAAMQKITRAIKAAQAAPDPDRAMSGLLPQIRGDVEKVVGAGAGIRIDQLDVSLPQGSLSSSLTIDIPPADDPANFRWSSAVLAAIASADIRMSAALFEMLAAMNPDLNAAVAMGFLKPDGEDYVLTAEYAKGMLNINGAPMPVPMPAM